MGRVLAAVLLLAACLLCVHAAGPSMAAPHAHVRAEATDARLHGQWQGVGMHNHTDSAWSVTFEESTFTAGNSNTDAFFQGTYTTDTNKSPMWVTLQVSPDEQWLGIYEFNGTDTHTVFMLIATDGAARPAHFDDAEEEDLELDLDFVAPLPSPTPTPSPSPTVSPTPPPGIDERLLGVWAGEDVHTEVVVTRGDIDITFPSPTRKREAGARESLVMRARVPRRAPADRDIKLHGPWHADPNHILPQLVISDLVSNQPGFQGTSMYCIYQFELLVNSTRTLEITCNPPTHIAFPTSFTDPGAYIRDARFTYSGPIHKHHKSLGAGAITGIVVGVLLLLIFVAVVIRKRRGRQSADSTHYASM